jgi:hypothetical protein
LIGWAGGAERSEFVSQSALLVKTQRVINPGKHHFDVVDGPTDPQIDMTRTGLGRLFGQSGKVCSLAESLIQEH